MLGNQQQHRWNKVKEDVVHMQFENNKLNENFDRVINNVRKIEENMRDICQTDIRLNKSHSKGVNTKNGPRENYRSILEENSNLKRKVDMIEKKIESNLINKDSISWNKGERNTNIQETV